MLTDTGVVAHKFSHYTRGGDRKYVDVKSATILISKKVKLQCDPCLDSAGAKVVEPYTYMLRVMLFERSQETHGHHHAPGL